MKKWLFFVIFALGCGFLHAQTLDYGMVHLGEKVSRTVPHDEVQATLLVREEGAVRNRVSNAATEKVNQVLKEAGKNKALKVSLTARSAYLNDNGKVKRWVDSASIRIVGHDFAAVNRLIADLQAVAALGDIHYRVSSASARLLRDEMTAEAIASFKQRAQHLSAQLGGNGYRLVSIDIDADNPNDAPVYAYRAARLHEASAVVADAGAGESVLSLGVKGVIQVTGLPY